MHLLNRAAEGSLPRSRSMSRHVTLLQERCVTRHRTAARETKPREEDGNCPCLTNVTDNFFVRFDYDTSTTDYFKTAQNSLFL